MKTTTKKITLVAITIIAAIIFGFLFLNHSSDSNKDVGDTGKIVLPKNVITEEECLELDGEIFNTLGKTNYEGKLIGKIEGLNCPCACRVDDGLDNVKDGIVTNFEECFSAGGILQYSMPPSCVYGGKSFFQSSESKVWVEVDPVQCLGNPWETDWLKENNNDYDAYPRGHILVIEEPEKKIIKEYYAKQGIEILDIKSEEFSGDFDICEACSCAQGYTLYLQISKKDLQTMLEFGYKLFESPDLICEDYTFSNCPRGCQKQCRSSACSEGPNPACTDDCDGPKSCVNFE